MIKNTFSLHSNALLPPTIKQTRRPTPNARSSHVHNVKGAARGTPRLLVLSFYSMLRNAPILVEDSHPPIILQINKQYSHICLRRDQHAFAARCPSSANIPHIFHNIPPNIRGYASSVVSDPPLSRSRKATTRISDKRTEDKVPAPPDHSILYPPKQAPSVWQIFFTDWLQNQRLQGGEDKKLNVAQEAKAAGITYNKLSNEDRDKLAARAKVFKDNYERELVIWKRTLTPADVERENAFRTAQRKSGKSRKKNINDPNAPKRPLSPYFLYLQAIRASPHMVKEVFGGVNDPTQQSVLAAAKWRCMEEADKRTYLEEAKNAKATYEAELKIYEEKTKSLNKGPLMSFLI